MCAVIPSLLCARIFSSVKGLLCGRQLTRKEHLVRKDQHRKYKYILIIQLFFCHCAEEYQILLQKLLIFHTVFYSTQVLILNNYIQQPLILF